MIKTETRQQNESVFVLSKTVAAVTKGVAISYIFLILAFVILAFVYTYTAMPDKFLNPATNIIGAVSIFTAGFAASAKAKTYGWLHGALAGIVYALIRIIIGIAVFKRYVPSAGILETLIISVVIAALGGIFGVNIQIKTRKKSKRNQISSFSYKVQ